MAESEPLNIVDCCSEGVEARRPGANVSPYAIHPNPLKRDFSRRRIFRTGAAAAAVTAAGVAVACRSDDPKSASSGAATPAATGANAGGQTSAPTSEAVAAKLEDIDLAYCSQVLCGIPFEVGVKHDFFKEEGLRVKLVYMKGGALAIQSLIGGSVDYVGSAMDTVVSAHGAGKQPLMVASVSSLPFFALVVSPKANIQSVKDLKGKKIGVGNLNTTEHLMTRFLMEKNGIDDATGHFVALGPNLYDGLLKGQVDAGLVQEPALTLVQQQGYTVLVNFMSKKDTTEQFGGLYQFMGLNTRPDVLEKKPDTLKKLIRGLTKSMAYIRASSGAEIVKNLPEELVAGGDLVTFAKSLDLVKTDLYPTDLTLNKDAIQRVIDVQKLSGALMQDVQVDSLFTNKLIGA